MMILLKLKTLLYLILMKFLFGIIKNHNLLMILWVLKEFLFKIQVEEKMKKPDLLLFLEQQVKGNYIHQ